VCSTWHQQCRALQCQPHRQPASQPPEQLNSSQARAAGAVAGSKSTASRHAMGSPGLFAGVSTTRQVSKSCAQHKSITHKQVAGDSFPDPSQARLSLLLEAAKCLQPATCLQLCHRLMLLAGVLPLRTQPRGGSSPASRARRSQPPAELPNLA